MGLFSRKDSRPEEVGLPLPELEEPEPIAEDEEPPGPPRVLKLDGDQNAGDDDDADLLALTGGADGDAAAP
ncbi:MAG TPA: hypothetical protein VNN12_05845, partial [Dehalococcoidia bacterium]|nr:hypothetical protein [Dehalococcoidia bacterium]